MIDERWKCIHCDWIGGIDQMLVAEHPFDPDDEVRGCPDCKEVNPFARLCDEPGCTQRATCGTPTPEGYRLACHEHRPAEESE